MEKKIRVVHVSCEPEFGVVCRLLGEQRTEQEIKEIHRIYDFELVQLRELVRPVAVMGALSANECGAEGEDHACECMTGDAVAQNKAEKAEYFAVLLTVGESGETYVRELFSQGEHLRALVADAMLSAWLFAMDEAVQEEIRTVCDCLNVGVAKRLEAPGQMPPESQKVICEALDAERLASVRVTDACMLVPEKSMCYVLELCGDRIQFAAGHDCAKCEKKDCEMRTSIPGRSGRNCEGSEQTNKMGKGIAGMQSLTNVKDSENRKHMIQVVVEDQGKKCVCTAGTVLLDTLREHGVRMDAPCGGSGRCGKCRVRVMSGELPVTAEDAAFLSERELANGVRLACTARPVSDLRIRVIAKAKRKMETVAEMSGVSVARGGEKVSVDDLSGKTGASGGDQGNGHEDHGVNDEKLLQECFTEDKNGYGIGTDIGTTTLAACLYGRTDATVLKTVTAVNSGRDFGADVLSRMEASCSGKRSRLQELLQEDVRALIAQLLAQTGVEAARVNKIVIAANMTMVHLLMGYSCETLGRAPFVPANKRMICADGMRILGDTSLRCPVIILPAVSAFVGGDIVSGMLALGMKEGQDTVLLLDVGTNGEMALRYQGQIYVTSTAAGPAFEGGGISCGCASVPGAVCGVKLNLRKKGTVQNKFTTIGDAAPVGICGSGVLELVSELLRVGYLDETGLFSDEYLENGFTLGKTVSGEPIVFTQGDVRALQLAKGAIRAGIEALLTAAGVKAQEVRQVYLAGGFGVRMDEQAAIHIGLLPEEFSGRIRPVGNSSLSGAVFAGRREQLEQECEMLLAQCKTVVLAEQPEFEENYLRYLNF